MFIVLLKIFLLFPYLIFRKIKDTKAAGVHLYGIYGYFGLPGRGKQWRCVMSCNGCEKSMATKFI